MSLAAALALLEQECLDLGLGSKDAPAPCTTRGYLLRSKCLALSSLRALSASGIGDDPDAVARWYKGQLAAGKSLAREEPVADLGTVDVNAS